MRFANRREAGRQLALHLRGRVPADTVVLGLPRGGVPVAFEVARALDLPLDVIVVRKLGVPIHPELAMGAIGEDGVQVVDDEVVRAARVTPEAFARVVDQERRELERRAVLLRDGHDRIDLRGRTALIVDDGIATGSTVRAACAVARAHGARRIILAAPVAPSDARTRLASAADELVVLQAPDRFGAVGQFYVDFAPVADEAVVRLLADGGTRLPRGPAADHPGLEATTEQEVTIRTRTAPLVGTLALPDRPTGIVIFAHGSGSSRHSPRNRAVAQVLNRAGIATLLMDLLTPDEEGDRANVFDVELLGRRLVDATRWVADQPELAGLPVGYFGASTGAAAALRAAAEPGAAVAAVVSRGGRPDLAGDRLPHVVAPTLLVVGSLDTTVAALNRSAAARMRCATSVVIVPGASHLFEEPGTLAAAADAARRWFLDHFAHPAPSRPPASPPSPTSSAGVRAR